MLTPQARATLQKRVNYSEFGTLTKQEFIQRAKENGWTIQAKEMNGHQNGEYNRIHANRLMGEAYEAYQTKMNKPKTVYSIHPPETVGKHFYDITRTEYEYFKSLC